MAGHSSAKAISVVNRGAIREVPHARVFEVDGSGGTYRVVFTADGISCNCQAGLHGVACYHAKAARLLMAQGREVRS